MAIPVLVGIVVADMPHLNYRPQVSQLVVLQLAQGLPPIEEISPLSSLEKEAKVENARLALLWQWGQEAPSLVWLRGRSNSNFRLQPGQTYSYIGILFPL